MVLDASPFPQHAVTSTYTLRFLVAIFTLPSVYSESSRDLGLSLLRHAIRTHVHRKASGRATQPI